MKKPTKTWFAIAAGLLILGGIILGGAISLVKWDFTKIATGKMETNVYQIRENFSNIAVKTDAADVVFAVSEDGNCTVECVEENKRKYTVTVEENALVIKTVDNQKWYEKIGIHLGTPKVTVYLPKGEYKDLLIREAAGDVQISNDFTFQTADILLSAGNIEFYASVSGSMKIKGSTGSICVENVSVGALDFEISSGEITASNVDCQGDVSIKVTTGKTQLTQMSCKNLVFDGDVGDIYLTNVIAAEKLSITGDTGDVKLDGTDAGEIYIETSTGDVTGTLLSEKVIFAKSNTGKVDVPHMLTGGKCEITTSTGDIKLEVK